MLKIFTFNISSTKYSLRKGDTVLASDGGRGFSGNAAYYVGIGYTHIMLYNWFNEELVDLRVCTSG